MSNSYAIAGLGSIGSIVAYHLRDQHVFSLLRSTGRECTRRVNIAWQHEQISTELILPPYQQQSLNWLIICTKASDTLAVLNRFPKDGGNIENILLLQNGMGQQQLVADWLKEKQQGCKRWQSCRLWLGLTTAGAYREDPQSIVYAGQGKFIYGLFSKNDHNEDSLLPPPFEYDINTFSKLINKLAINAVINPLTAIYRCKNGELLTDRKKYEQLRKLTNEIDHTMRQLHWLIDVDLLTLVEDVAHATANNISSTLQDVLSGRPTELAYINGYILEQALNKGITMPITDALLSKLRQDHVIF